ncbi:MAG TPA: 16S rRNA (uracil(1498)-N(3))-methyltransferase, partial [Desulfosarcina sp.]|nr:16S rRNA (uracil(1498)-N(3))-methyltransferase [Desulfosarcina sp.]
MNLRRFYITPEMAGLPRTEITGSDAGHICRVLRLAAGDTVELFDGAGSGYRARIVSATPRRVQLAVEASYLLQSESPVAISVAQAVLKDRKMDDLVRQLTELGIARWMPFYAARSVPVPGKKDMGPRRGRWEKIAVEAVKQCRRGRIPRISPVGSFDDILAASAEHDVSVLFWEGAPLGFDLSAAVPPMPRSMLLAIG